MNKLILTVSLCIVSFVSPSETSPKVFICMGSMSECYHKNKDCKGLEKCSTKIKEVTLEQAKKMGRRPCGYCYK